jgi:dihydroorotase
MTLTIRAMSDYHVHLRTGDMLTRVTPASTAQCGRILVMPNLPNPVSTPDRLDAYIREVGRAVAGEADVVFTFKLLPTMTPGDVAALHAGGATAGKLYPEGMTTNAEDGIPGSWLAAPPRYPRQTPEVADYLRRIRPFLDVLREMERLNMVLCMHGEVPGERTFVYNRTTQATKSSRFLDFVDVILDQFPGLRMVIEHISTDDEVEFVRQQAKTGHRIAATITSHHLCLTVEDILGKSKLNPHHFCLPVPKLEEDRLALVRAATQGEPYFFFGSDSAPHPKEAKECAACCGGIFTAPVNAQVLAEVFEEQNALDKLEGFTSTFGDRFYDRRPTDRKIVLKRTPYRVLDEYSPVRTFRQGDTLRWTCSPA